jgi:hypothetical protein
MAFTNIHNYLKRLKKGHLHGKSRSSTILKKNKKKKEGDIGMEQRGLVSTTTSIAPNLSVLGTTHLHETILEYEVIFQLKNHMLLH